MARAHKAIAFIVIALSFLQVSFAQSSLSLAQRHPMAPKDNDDFYKTCILAYQADIHIPLYLDNSRSASIKYNWYHTAELFGELTRTEELPYHSEEGTYINGRLSTYKHSLKTDETDSYVYIDKITWSPDGKINTIKRYKLDGSLSKSFNEVTGSWHSHLVVETTEKYGKFGYGHIEADDLFVTYSERESSSASILGYQIKGQYLYEIFRNVQMSYRKVYGAFTDKSRTIKNGWIYNKYPRKDWRGERYYETLPASEKVGNIHYTGNVGGYDPNDKLSFDCYEF